MGSGASIEFTSLTEDELIDKFALCYATDPSKMDRVIQIGLQRAKNLNNMTSNNNSEKYKTNSNNNNSSSQTNTNTTTNDNNTNNTNTNTNTNTNNNNNNNNNNNENNNENNNNFNITKEDVLKEINSVRTNPTFYIAKLEARMNKYRGKVLRRKGRKSILTHEGVDAVRECIEYLENEAQPLQPLTLSDLLSEAALSHCQDIGPKGLTSQQGSDGSTMQQRFEKYGEWSGIAGENIGFGEFDAEGIVISFLVDDGVSSRGHRLSLLNPQFNVAGIGIGPHQTFESCFVIDLAGGFGPKRKIIDHAMTVEALSGETNSDFEDVLAALPLGFNELRERVREAMSKGKDVTLEYEPGKIETQIDHGDGTSTVLNGSWAITNT